MEIAPDIEFREVKNGVLKNTAVICSGK